MSAPCPERHFGMRGEIQCTQGVGHDKCHAHYDGPQLVAAWLTRDEFEAAKARGDYDHDDYCRCEDPRPVCDDCGGEIL